MEHYDGKVIKWKMFQEWYDSFSTHGRRPVSTNTPSAVVCSRRVALETTAWRIYGTKMKLILLMNCSKKT
jgi:hypothetical protein